MASVALSKNIFKLIRTLGRQITIASSLHVRGLTVIIPYYVRRRVRMKQANSRNYFCSGAICQMSQTFNHSTTSHTLSQNHHRKLSSELPEVQCADVPVSFQHLASTFNRLGFVRKSHIKGVIDELITKNAASPNQVLLVIRCCGSILAEETPEDRTQLVHHLWDQIQLQGMTLDSSHYNSLLQVYLQNEYEFSPSKFLTLMDNNGVQPTKITYEFLVSAHCIKGDVEKADEIIEMMKSKDLPMTETIFNSLITGHAKAGDMDSAQNIFSDMQKCGLEPGIDSYTALMVAHAENENIAEVQKIIQELYENPESLPAKTFLKVACALGRHGNNEHISPILEGAGVSGTIPDAIYACSDLVLKGREEAAFEIIKSLKCSDCERGVDEADVRDFFLCLIAKKALPVSSISNYCKQMMEFGLHSHPFNIVIASALRESLPIEYCTELFKEAKEKGVDIRPHYFWPLFSRVNLQNDMIKHLVDAMTELEVEVTSEAYKEYDFQEMPVEELESFYAHWKQKGKFSAGILKQLILKYASSYDYENAIRFKKEFEDAGFVLDAPAYVALVDLCGKVGKIQEAYQYKNTLDSKYPKFKMLVENYRHLVLHEVQAGNDEGVRELIQEINRKNWTVRKLFFIIVGLTEEGLYKEALDVLERLVSLGIVIPSMNLVNPILNSFVMNDDLEGAMRLMSECKSKYNFIPTSHEYLVKLIEKGDSTGLQKAMDFLRNHLGNMNMLHDLCFAFISARRLSEAQEIIDAPGFEVQDGAVKWFAHKCFVDDHEMSLLGLLDVTKSIKEFPRETIYFKLLQLYGKRNEPENCLRVLDTMREEEMTPSETTMQFIDSVVKSSNRGPFHVIDGVTSVLDTAEMKVTDSELPVNLHNLSKPIVNHVTPELDTCITNMMEHLREGNIDEALRIKARCQEFPDFRLRGNMLNDLLRGCAMRKDFENCQLLFDEAVRVGVRIHEPVLTVFADLYSERDDLEGLLDLKQLYECTHNQKFPASGTFLKLYYNRSGLGAALQHAESAIKTDRRSAARMNFRDFFQTLVEKDTPMDQIYDFVVRQVQDGIDSPFRCLLVVLMDNMKLDGVKYLLQEYPLIKEAPHFFMNYSIKLSRNSEKNPDTITILQNLLDITRDDPFLDRNMLFTCQLNACVLIKDYKKGLEIKEAMELEGLQMNESNLKRLDLHM